MVQNDKTVALTKQYAYTGEKFNDAKMIFVFDKVENILRKRENAGHLHILLFPQCFQKVFVSGLLKLWIVWQRVLI